MKSNLYLISLAVFFLACQLRAQYLNEAPAEAVGISMDHLEILDDHILGYIDRGIIPGGIFLVARRGKIVFYKSFGSRSVEGRPYEKDDLFRLASMTKAITSVAIMQLYEKGKLGLDDPVHYYIPSFADSRVLGQFNEADSTFTTEEVIRPITIRHLLTHTSGITYGDFNPGKLQAVYEKFELNGVGLYHDLWTTEEFVDRIADVPLAFQPGSQYLYGLNMDVLGRVVEVVSGMELDAYFEKNIFEPLGMRDTYFHLPGEKHSRLVPVYSQEEDGEWVMLENGGIALKADYPKMSDNQHYAGGGGLTGSTMDYAQFLQALLNGGELNGRRILSRNAIETMTSDQLIVQNKNGKGISTIPGVSFCLGFLLYTEDGAGISMKSPGTFEWGGYFNTKFFIDPDEELIFVGMTQVLPFQRPDFWDRMYNIIYGSITD